MAQAPSLADTFLRELKAEIPSLATCAALPESLAQATKMLTTLAGKEGAPAACNPDFTCSVLEYFALKCPPSRSRSRSSGGAASKAPARPGTGAAAEDMVLARGVPVKRSAVIRKARRKAIDLVHTLMGATDEGADIDLSGLPFSSAPTPAAAAAASGGASSVDQTARCGVMMDAVHEDEFVSAEMFRTVASSLPRLAHRCRGGADTGSVHREVRRISKLLAPIVTHFPAQPASPADTGHAELRSALRGLLLALAQFCPDGAGGVEDGNNTTAVLSNTAWLAPSFLRLVAFSNESRDGIVSPRARLHVWAHNRALWEQHLLRAVCCLRHRPFLRLASHTSDAATTSIPSALSLLFGLLGCGVDADFTRPEREKALWRLYCARPQLHRWAVGLLSDLTLAPVDARTTGKVSMSSTSAEDDDTIVGGKLAMFAVRRLLSRMLHAVWHEDSVRAAWRHALPSTQKKMGVQLLHAAASLVAATAMSGDGEKGEREREREEALVSMSAEEFVEAHAALHRILWPSQVPVDAEAVDAPSSADGFGSFLSKDGLGTKRRSEAAVEGGDAAHERMSKRPRREDSRVAAQPLNEFAPSPPSSARPMPGQRTVQGPHPPLLQHVIRLAKGGLAGDKSRRSREGKGRVEEPLRQIVHNAAPRQFARVRRSLLAYGDALLMPLCAAAVALDDDAAAKKDSSCSDDADVALWLLHPDVSTTGDDKDIAFPPTPDQCRARDGGKPNGSGSGTCSCCWHATLRSLRHCRQAREKRASSKSRRHRRSPGSAGTRNHNGSPASKSKTSATSTSISASALPHAACGFSCALCPRLLIAYARVVPASRGQQDGAWHRAAELLLQTKMTAAEDGGGGLHPSLVVRNAALLLAALEEEVEKEEKKEHGDASGPPSAKTKTQSEQHDNNEAQRLLRLLSKTSLSEGVHEDDCLLRKILAGACEKEEAAKRMMEMDEAEEEEEGVSSKAVGSFLLGRFDARVTRLLVAAAAADNSADEAVASSSPQNVDGRKLRKRGRTS